MPSANFYQPHSEFLIDSRQGSHAGFDRGLYRWHGDRQVKSIEKSARRGLEEKEFLLDSYTYEHYSAHMFTVWRGPLSEAARNGVVGRA